MLQKASIVKKKEIMSTIKEESGFALEAKSLLSKKGFKILKNFFKIKTGSFEEHSSKIFIDENMNLVHLLPVGTILRLCSEKKNTLELKIHGENEALITNTMVLNNNQHKALVEDGVLPDGNIKSILAHRKVTGPFTCFGMISRRRSMAVTNNTWDVTIALDETTYSGGRVDYEIKVFCSQYDHSIKVLQLILNKHGIVAIPAPLKIQRFYQAVGISTQQKTEA